MSRFTGFLAVLFLLPANAFSQDYDVNSAYWGMSPLDVQISEGRPPDWKGFEFGHYRLMFIHYTKYKNNREYPNGKWHYSFDKNKLFEATYDHQWAKKDLVRKFNFVKKNMTEMAGPPTKTRTSWKGQPMQVVEWKYGRTFVQARLEDKPMENGLYWYQVVFRSTEYMKEGK